MLENVLHNFNTNVQLTGVAGDGVAVVVLRTAKMLTRLRWSSSSEEVTTGCGMTC